MMRHLAWFLLLLAATAPASAAEPGACVDEQIKADLMAKRRRQNTKERLFQQQNRHELTALGGYFVSDLFEGTYVVGGAYSYHMTEDFAVQATGAYTQFSSAGTPERERAFSVLGGRAESALLFDADLVWTPIHAKLRAGGSIAHFDIYGLAGAGLIDSALSTGLAGNVGLGFKFFLGKAYAIRVEVRDYLYRQQLLSRTAFASDLSATLGLSLFLPLGE